MQRVQENGTSNGGNRGGGEEEGERGSCGGAGRWKGGGEELLVCTKSGVEPSNLREGNGEEGGRRKEEGGLEFWLDLDKTARCRVQCFYLKL